jgi:hypothetical protein
MRQPDAAGQTHGPAQTKAAVGPVTTVPLQQLLVVHLLDAL